MKAFLEWGIPGVDRAVARGDVIVIIDVLRFTSAATTAINNGFVVIPARDAAEAELKLRGSPKSRLNGSGLSVLSPQSFMGKQPCEVILHSPHGATLSCHAAGVDYAFLGSLLNTTSVSNMIKNAASASGRDITIICSGERGSDRAAIMPEFERVLDVGNGIFCFEDYVAAGAIGSKIDAEKSSALLLAEKAFIEYAGNLPDLFPKTASGQYLVAQGFAEDVQFCASVDIYQVTPKILKHDDGVIIVPGD